MNRLIYTTILGLIVVSLFSCSKTPIETVKNDIKVYLSKKYNKTFTVDEYVQFLSNEGNGFADHHILKMSPINNPENTFPIEIRYKNNTINIIRDGYFVFSEDGKRIASKLNSIIEKYSKQYATQIKEVGFTKIRNVKPLNTSTLNNITYPNQLYFLISIFTDQKNVGKLDSLLYSDIIAAFRENSECIRVGVRHYPVAMYKDDITFEESLVLKPNKITGVQLNKKRLNEFNGQFRSIQKYYERSVGIGCPTHYM